MTNARKHGLSRPDSSRGTRDLGELRKGRHAKPYSIEPKAITNSKKKIGPRMSSNNRAPPGYKFLAIGTQELARRCIELSSQKGFDVVNVAAAHNKWAQDPNKVSHHIAKIGYYFKSEVLEQACEELGYIPIRNKYVKEATLVLQGHEDRKARIVAKHGLVLPTTDYMAETEEQVRSTIKELFPKIPDDDLDDIVERSWAVGSNRVGTQTDLPLWRRAQLATIARIRHVYTDYDRLLSAFTWLDARSMVESVSLKKLREWRGESDEDDEMLVNLSRAPIVPNGNNDDVAGQGNESEVIEISDDDSDDSIEFIHERVAAGNEIGAEIDDETARGFLNRYQPYKRMMAVQAQPVIIQPDAHDIAEFNGRKFRRVQIPNEPVHTPPQHYPQQHPQQQGASVYGTYAYPTDVTATPSQLPQHPPQYSHQYSTSTPSYAPYQVPQRYHYATAPDTANGGGQYRHDRAIPSIEREHDYTREPIVQERPQYHLVYSYPVTSAEADPFVRTPLPATQLPGQYTVSGYPVTSSEVDPFARTPLPAAHQPGQYTVSYGYPVHGGMAPVQQIPRRDKRGYILR